MCEARRPPDAQRERLMGEAALAAVDLETPEARAILAAAERLAAPVREAEGSKAALGTGTGDPGSKGSLVPSEANGSDLDLVEDDPADDAPALQPVTDEHDIRYVWLEPERLSANTLRSELNKLSDGTRGSKPQLAVRLRNALRGRGLEPRIRVYASALKSEELRAHLRRAGLDFKGSKQAMLKRLPPPTASDEAPPAGAPTSAVWSLIGCPRDHTSRATRCVNGCSSERYRYQCGVCGMYFTQLVPACIPGGHFHKRDARVANIPRARGAVPAMDCGYQTKRTAAKACLADTVLRTHNPGGLKNKERWLPYLHLMMRGAHALGIQEFALSAAETEDMRTVILSDPQINAHLFVSGSYRRNAGVALLVARTSPTLRNPVQRLFPGADAEHDPPQILIVDVETEQGSLRLLVTYGPSGAKLHFKKAHLLAIEKALLYVQRLHGAVPTVWMADHNMVMEPSLDEERGSRTGAQYELLRAAYRRVEQMASVTDAFRAIHGDKRAYTHGVRRIDRCSVPLGWVGPDSVGKLPRLLDARHIERVDSEYVVREGSRWKVVRHEHKVVEVVLRFTEVEREPLAWKWRGDHYPPALMATVYADIQRCVRPEAPGTAAEKQEAWITAARVQLETHEKTERKALEKQRQTELRLMRDWTRKREQVDTDSDEAKRLTAQLSRLEQRRAARLIADAMRRSKRARVDEWRTGPRGVRELFASIRPTNGTSDLVTRLNEPPATSHDEVMEACTDKWEEVFNVHERARHALSEDECRQQDAREQAATDRVLDAVRAHVSELGDLSKSMEALAPDRIFSESNIAQAIQKLKKGTEPGDDGFTSDFYAQEQAKQLLTPHLRRLFLEVARDEIMSEAMREALISVLYKGKGKDPLKLKSYRPIALTVVQYRIMTVAIQLSLTPVMERLLGSTQVAYMKDGRYTHDNTLLLAEAMRCLDRPGRGGVALLADNASAFDRVKWKFIADIMSAYGFPPAFAGVLAALYKDLTFRIKINGLKGAQCRITNSVRQGCGVSPQIFNLVQEALLIMIRRDPELQGVRLVPNGAEVRERCAADDTVVYLDSVRQLPRLSCIIADFELASGQLLDLRGDKTFALLAGGQQVIDIREHIRQAGGDEALNGITWLRYGVDVSESSLGIVVGTEEQVQAEEHALHEVVRRECTERMAASKACTSLSARVTLIAGSFASKLWYKPKVQVSEQIEAEAKATQRVFDTALLGEQPFITRQLALQPTEDGGLGHIHVLARYRAEWADLALDMHRHRERPKAWQEIWWHELREVYGELATPALLHSTCGFALLEDSSTASPVQRRAFAALGAMLAPTGRIVEQPADRRSKAARGWEVAWILDQCLFFSPWLVGGRLARRSTREVEAEAVAWAQAGLVQVRHLVRSQRPLTLAEFAQAYPQLAVGTYRELLAALPYEWWDVVRLRPRYAQHYCTEVVVGVTPTLRSRSPKAMHRLRTADVYERLVAKEWVLPSAFDACRAQGPALATWKEAGRPDAAFLSDVHSVYRGIRTPGVPAWLADRVYRCATSTDRSIYFGGCGAPRACARCGCTETNAHRYKECAEVQRFWGWVLAVWERVSGERLYSTDSWVTRWGMRSHTWADPASAQQYGGADLELVFRTLHAAAIGVIFDESQQARPRQARAMLPAYKKLVLSILEDQRTLSPGRFTRAWKWTGLVEVHRGQVCPAFWDSAWRRPAPLSADDATPSAVEIFTDGSATGHAGGWGWCAVVDGQEVATSSGPVVTNANHPEWRGADRATNNCGEVLAMIEALTWAKGQPYDSVSIRYDSQYAARQTQGKWKAKKNKALIVAARGALKAVEAVKDVRFLHVKGHSGNKWNDRADALAAEGAASCTPHTTPVTKKTEGISAQGDVPLYAGKRTVRGVTWEATETTRIERARTRHGILNLPVRGNRSPALLAAAQKECESLLAQELQRRQATAECVQRALTRVRQAAKQLEDKAMQRLEVRERKAGWYTMILECPINVAALQRLKASEGARVFSADAAGTKTSERTFGQAIEGLLAAATRAATGETVITLRYRFSALGRDLVDAGHISACREQAEGADPFKLPREIRQAAFSGMGWEMDDSSAFPRARIAMVKQGRAQSQFLVDHKEDIMRKFAQYLFPDLGWPEQKRRMKSVINGIDMDSGLDAWVAKYGNPQGKSLKGKRVHLSGGTVYALEDYQRAQRQGTTELAAASPRMLAYVTEHMKPSERARANKPALRMKSYLLQEAEAVSREAKVNWCREQGLRVLNLQHDGIFVESLPAGLAAAEVAELLGAAASRAAGYEVIVAAEWVEVPAPLVVD